MGRITNTAQNYLNIFMITNTVQNASYARTLTEEEAYSLSSF